VTTTALLDAAREARAAWRPRSSLVVALFAVAAFAPLGTSDARTADLADGLYLACAAVGLALAVGLGGLPSLAQGGFVAVGASVGAHLLDHGVPTAVAAVAGGVAGAAAGALVGVAFAHLPRAGFAAATWIVSWLVAFAADSLTWVLGGSQGIVVTGGPTPGWHYELALALTALAALGYTALSRGPFGLRLAAARDREGGARSLRVPARRLRAAVVAASGAVAGLTGALAVQLAGVADPSTYSPYLSFKLFVVVLLGGAVAPLGAPAGMIVLALLSVAADALGSLEHVAASRSHALLAAVLLLGVVSLGWEGLVRPRRASRRAAGAPPHRHAPRGLTAEGLTKRYGDLTAVDDVTLTADPGTITALVGPNGSGKTTVLRLLDGALAPDAGEVHGQYAVTRTLQATAVFPTLTPLEHVLVASAGRRRHGGFFRTLFATPKMRAEDAAFVAEAHALLARFGLPAGTPAGELPASDQRVLMLAAAYATGAPVLLVDEPTAGATAAETERIGALLRDLRTEGLALVVVEHNLGVVRSLADRVVVLDAGRVIAEGTPAEVADDERVRTAYLGRGSLSSTVPGA
jgi:ABC-type branched-subunit amino acid transport system ATPase component/ABC-type branched-subunit amino acid transport system permease subunit